MVRIIACRTHDERTMVFCKHNYVATCIIMDRIYSWYTEGKLSYLNCLKLVPLNNRWNPQNPYLQTSGRRTSLAYWNWLPSTEMASLAISPRWLISLTCLSVFHLAQGPNFIWFPSPYLSFVVPLVYTRWYLDCTKPRTIPSKIGWK